MDKLEFEKKCLENGYKIVAGIDEAGRGPLAGPVVAAAVVMPTDELIEGVDDSKQLSEKKREILFEEIKSKAISYCIAEVSEKEIDEINILEATKNAMKNAEKGLAIMPDITLVDGIDLHLPFNAEYIVKGDAKSYSVACASILAKVYRDRLMKEYAKEFPEYGFEKHKGYGTKVHIDKIREIGPCRLHRKTFIKNFWEEREK